MNNFREKRDWLKFNSADFPLKIRNSIKFEYSLVRKLQLGQSISSQSFQVNIYSE